MSPDVSPSLRRLPLALSRTFRLTTGLPREILAGSLRENIVSPEVAGQGEAAGPFVGTVHKKGFSIIGFRHYRSSHLPAVQGLLEKGEDGTDLRLTMGPHRAVVVFLSIWYSFLFLAFCALSLAVFSKGPLFLFLAALPAAMGAASWILTSYVFDSDCRWALRIFRDSLPLPSGEEAPPRRHSS